MICDIKTHYLNQNKFIPLIQEKLKSGPVYSQPPEYANTPLLGRVGPLWDLPVYFRRQRRRQVDHCAHAEKKRISLGGVVQKCLLTPPRTPFGASGFPVRLLHV